mgnify:CR=1 FL=1
MKEKNVLVTGGTGYIGSHTVKQLIKGNYNITVIDNLQRGHIQSIPKEVNLIKGDLSDQKLLNKVLKEHKIDAVLHFAGFIEAGESMIKPEKYFTNNISNGINLLNVMIKNNVKKIIYSSSAAVYGIPKNNLIKEENETKPINPYGETKLIFEKILKWYEHAYGLKYVSLRYFNAAGADISGEIGEDHDPETHLIPLIMQAALGKRENIQIFGTDYETKDGTCIRDYIHVTDLADAHILALKWLIKGKESRVFNLGNGNGFSVKEIIDLSRKITGKDIPIVEASRREGDPARLVASSDKIKKELKWNPRYDIKKIIETAWNWHKNHPKGFSKN